MPSHHEVAHAWAHQTGKQRNGKSVFYEGPRIYSYGRHFLIARLLDVKGVPSVLFTTRDYSVSTSKHKSIVRGAVRHLPTYLVRDPGQMPGLDDWEHDLSIAAEHVAKAGRCRLDWRKNSELNYAQNALDRANSLNEAFDLKAPKVSLDTLGVEVANRDARLAKARAKAERDRKKAEKERFAREAENRAAWLAGEASYWRGTMPDGAALLRVQGDEIQTSQGAAVPLTHATKAFQFVKLCRDQKTAWARNGHTLRVGHFQIDRIEPNGDFKAGCHLIRWSETERIAKALGILDSAPSADALEPSTAHA